MEVYDEDFIRNDFLGSAEYTLTEHEENGKSREQVVDVTLKGKKEGTLTLGIFVRHLAYDVEITFVKGNGLKSSDVMSKSDPYLKAKLNAQDYQTSVINNTLDPEWGEKWFAQNVLGGSKLEIDVLDKDIVSSDFLGHAVYVFAEEEPLDKKKNLTLNVKDGEKEQGTLTIELGFKIHGKK